MASRTESEPATKLGRLLFRFEGTPYYRTERVARLIPGVHTRMHGPKTLLRIVTLEQALLDSLYKPSACGGPEVVFEAWTEAHDTGRIDEERIVDYLRRMHYPATIRRVGAMYDFLERTPGNELRELIETTRAQIDRESPYAVISLLPGIAYPNLDRESLVRIP